VAAGILVEDTRPEGIGPEDIPAGVEMVVVVEEEEEEVMEVVVEAGVVMVAVEAEDVKNKGE
jgi:hypothetical protein